MASLATPLTTGDALPDLDFVTATGARATLTSLVTSSSPPVLYFMRTSTCPVCHQHLRHLARMVDARDLDEIVVIVPGGVPEADSVARRHPVLAGRVVASETAHAAVGLFVRMGLQQSGTFVAHAGRVTYARHATVPVGSFDAAETRAAVRRAAAVDPTAEGTT